MMTPVEIIRRYQFTALWVLLIVTLELALCLKDNLP